MTMKNRAWLIDDAGIVLLGLLSLGYSIFSRWFAELNLNLPYLDFPIFIGEIALFICLCLLGLKWIITHQKNNPRYYILVGYVIFVLAKALYGYFKFGPLAFRHAALFYYPLFAVCSYFFYRKGFFNLKKVIVLLLVFIAIFLTNNFYEYYALTFLVLVFILINALLNKKARFILTFLLLFIAPGKLFSHSYRTILTSNIASTIFIICTIPFILNIKKSYKALILISLILGSVFGVIKLSDSNALKSLIDFQKNIELYRQYTDIIRKEQDNYIMKEGEKVKIYNKETPLRLSFLKKSQVPETEEQDNIDLPISEPSERPLKIRAMSQGALSPPEPIITPTAAMPTVVQEAPIEEILPEPVSEETKPTKVAETPIIEKLEPVVKEEPAEGLALSPPESETKAPATMSTIEKLGPVVKEEPIEEAKLSPPEPIIAPTAAMPIIEKSELIEEILPEPVIEEAEPVVVQEEPVKKLTISKDFETAMNKSIFHLHIWKDLWIVGAVEEKKAPGKIIREEPMEALEEPIIREEESAIEEGGTIELQQEPQQPIEKQAKPEKPRSFRNYETAINNSVFRILIWKDLWRDINDQRPLLGFDFGKPFRSKNIEILNIAQWEWIRDGWICAHNSYLEIIYRAGIVGFLFIFGLFAVLFMLIKQTIDLKSLKGVFLCSILLNWMIAAVFMVILELPYNAIPFWALFGMTFAHLFNKKSSIIN